MDAPPLKKPKTEPRDGDGAGGGAPEEEHDEEVLEALVAHRAAEVERLKLKLLQYQSLLDEAEKRLSEVQAKLASRGSRSDAPCSNQNASNHVNGALGSRAPAQRPPLPSSRPQLLIPAFNTKVAPVGTGRSTRPIKLEPKAMPSALSSTRANGIDKPKQGLAAQEKRVKRKLEQREHRDLIPSMHSCSSPKLLRFHSSTLISSQHKRKLRCLELCPNNDLLLVTSALDGIVTLWQVQATGPSASLLSTIDCLSPKHRRWPEDIAWHPDGDMIFAAYSADGGDSQISTLNLNAKREKKVTFLEGKPHHKGIINSINFMPWADICFATGGSDHAVVLWQEREDSWKHKTVHGNFHSSAVMGVSGLQQRKTILSVGADKRIVAFDLSAGRSDFKYQIEHKCMSVLPNPSDFNLYLVQTASPGKQLHLYDIRLRQTEIHTFGWKQESSDSQSALINQSWSPDGWYVSSGSADPMIHIFDIRYDGCAPSQSVQAHQKRVFKAVWHQSAALLTSISSDLNIGLHKVA